MSNKSQELMYPDGQSSTSNNNPTIMPSSESPYIPTSTVDSMAKTIQPDNLKTTDISQTSTQAEQPMVDISSSSVVIESKNGSSGFKKFIIIGLIFILLIYAGVAYLYFQNKSLKDIMTAIPKNLSVLTPTPFFDPQNIKIENGSVVYKQSNNVSKIIVDKASFPSTGIAGFSRLIVSPQNKYICFEALPPSTKPGLYITDIDGVSPKLVSSNKSSCLWKSDESYVVYKGQSSGLKNVNIFKYDLASGEETNLTANTELQNDPDFDIVGFSSDESNIICTYENSQGEIAQCQVDPTTGEFKSL